jgi:hypothetical protein
MQQRRLRLTGVWYHRAVASPYLLSLLARQLPLLGARFNARYPHAWLVWEPGLRVKPPENAQAASTQFPSSFKWVTPEGGDAVCFGLIAPEAEGERITVGRTESCAIYLDDMTVSREHLRLFTSKGRWFAEVPHGASAAVMIRKISLQPGEPIELHNGCSISAGGVQLTFYEKDKLLPRLEGEAKKLGLVGGP